MPFTIADVMPRKKCGEASFGERLQAIRKARGLTQVQLAEAAATTQRAVSYYETEAGFPPAPAVIALAKALKVTTDEMLGVNPPRVERVRLIHSLVATGASRRSGSVGEHNGR
jgi:transcriptional regulator with XRE-family HTH domain